MFFFKTTATKTNSTSMSNKLYSTAAAAIDWFIFEHEQLEVEYGEKTTCKSLSTVYSKKKKTQTNQ